MTKDTFDYKLEILTKEWDHVQNHIGRFDSIVFNIRGWAVSAFTAMLAVSATQKLPNLMLLTILPVSMFWFVEALHKNFQRYFIQRGAEIESYLASDAFVGDSKSRSGIAIVAPAMAAQFSKKPFVSRMKSVLEAAFLWNVWTIYSALLVLCILTHFFLRAGT